MEKPAAEKVEDYGDTHLSSVEAIMLMEEVIYDGRVIDKHHKVFIKLMGAAVELQSAECGIMGAGEDNVRKGKGPGGWHSACDCNRVCEDPDDKVWDGEVAVASEKELTLQG